MMPMQLATDTSSIVQPLAELVTATGRDILQATVDLVEGELGLEVCGPRRQELPPLLRFGDDRMSTIREYPFRLV